MQVSIKVDVKQATRFLLIKQREIPFAVARAITRTLFIARRDLQQQMRKDLDRPTPFTLRGVFVDRADKQTLTGRVYLQSRQDEYLDPQIRGGQQVPKTGTAFALPPRNAAAGVRDRFGNVRKGKRAKAELQRKGRFSGKIGPRQIGGVWQRLPGKARAEEVVTRSLALIEGWDPCKRS